MRKSVLLLCALALLASCHYDVSLTAGPTRVADERLLGQWKMIEPERSDAMEVRLWDEHQYVIAYRGDVYRAFHSDAAGLPFLSVQNLNDDERKWLFFVWSLSADGKTLTMRAVRTEAVPANITNRAALVDLIAKNSGNPRLFGEPGVFTK